MVRSESADEEFMLSSGKVSGNEEDDEYLQWSHSTRRASSSCRGGEGESPPNGVACSMVGGDEQADRRIRRQIANCNERRRMQSINAGFQSLRSLLPKRDGEKMSKAAILQHTAELIQSLQAEKMRLLEEKEAAIQAKKRRIEDDEVRERGLVDELTVALEKERQLRQLYEQQLRERRASSPMVSPTLPSGHSTPLIHPAIDSSVLRTRSDIPGLLHHPLPIDGFASSSPYLLRSPGSFTQTAVKVECNMTSEVAASQQRPQQQQQQPQQTSVEALPQAPLLMNSMENHSTANLSHRNLNAILEAIRHLEGGGALMNNNSSPAQQQPQQSNVLVR